MARDPDHARIAHKAHELWESEGRPHGRDQEHWDQAREMVAVEDSQRDTLLPRDTGAEAPIEEPDEALRNLADMPNLTDQGENLLTSTDREPPLIATPSGRKGRMPKVEVPTSDQPGIPGKTRKAAPKSEKTAPKVEKAESAKKPAASKSSAKPAAPVSAEPEAVTPKTASVPKAAAAAAGAAPKADTAAEEFTPRRSGRRRKGE